VATGMRALLTNVSVDAITQELLVVDTCVNPQHV